MKFKTEEVQDRFMLMHPRAQELAREMDEWTMKHFGKELTITATTSTAAEDKALGRVSDTHRTGRAFDIRTSDLTDTIIANLCTYFRRLYNQKLGASSNKQCNLIVYRPHGTGPHLHVQLNRKYTRLVGDIDVKKQKQETKA